LFSGKVISNEGGNMRLATVALVALAWAGLGFGQEKQAKPEARGKSEGIKVHGHWVLEIKNPDGSLASRHEFENSLATATDTGPLLLSFLLTGQYAAGPWMVYLQLNDAAGTSLVVAESPSVCTLLHNQNPAGGPCSSTLGVSSGAVPLVLQGTTPGAPFAGSIIQVGSVMYPCSGDLSPVSCEPAAIPAMTNGSPTTGLLFTTATLSGITIKAGQAVTVSVTISFS
jgi:hypothetical protein